MRADIVYAVLGIVSNIIIIVCAVEVIIQNKSFAIRGVISYISLLLTFMAGNAFFIVQVLSKDTDFSFLMFKLQTFSTILTVFFYVLFLRINLKTKKFNILPISLFLAGAALFSYLIFLNPFSLFYKNYELAEIFEGVFQLQIDFNYLFFIFQGLLYSVFLFWVVKAVYASIKGVMHKLQSIFMIFSVVPLIITNILYLLKITHFDMTNILFAVSAILLTVCLTKYGIMDTLQYFRSNFLTLFSDPFFILLPDGQIEYLNGAAEKIFDIKTDEVKGKKYNEINSDFPIIENFEINKGNSVYKISATKLVNKSGRNLATTVILKDITEQKRTIEKLEYLTSFDKVTGLINTDRFVEKVQSIKDSSERGLENSLMLAVGIENDSFFKGITSVDEKNDLYKQIVGHITGLLDKNFEMSRFSDNEFFIFSNDQRHSLKYITDLFERSYKKEFNIFGTGFNVIFNMGIYVAENKDITVNEAIEKASYALRAAFLNSMSYKVYDFNLSQQHELKKNLITSLPSIDYMRDFYLEFQPIVDIKNNKVAGAEALLRWKHPIYGNLSPALFIPIFESANEMGKLGEVIISKACDAILNLKGIIEEDFKLSVNISKKQVDNENIVDEIKRIIREKKIDPKYLDFEITETAASKKHENVKSFSRRIKEMGSSVSLDDFGSGDTSIAYITEFGVDKLKLDISISDNAHVDKQRGIIVKSLLQMCNNLKIDVVVEHVENIDALESLSRQGFSLIQGYIFSRSLPLKAFAEFYIEFNKNKKEIIKTKEKVRK